MDVEEQITLFSVTDVYGTITFVNEAFCEVAKYSREELVNKPHNIVRHPDMPKKLFKLCWSAIKKGDTFKAVIKNKAKDGTHYWVDTIIVPVVNRHHKIIQYVSACHLITDDAKAEELFAEQVKLLDL